MIVEFLLAFFSACLLMITIRENYFPSKNLPPGPLHLPIIGSALHGLLNLQVPPVVTMKRLVEKYGPVVYLKLGPQPVVLVGELEAAKLVLSNEIWEDRPYLEIISQRSWGLHLGIVYGIRDGWREMRRFSLRTLRGVGNATNINQTMEDGLRTLMEEIDKVADQAEPILKVRRFFAWPVLQVLWSMLCSVRSAEEEQKLKELFPIVEHYSETFIPCGGLLHVLPWLRHIAPEATGFTDFMRGATVGDAFAMDLLNYRRKEYADINNRRDDWVDAFIANMEKREQGGTDPNLEHYTEQQFSITLGDLLFGGAETTINGLEFAIYFVSRHPRVQKRIQEEVDRVVGRSRLPSMGDKSMMPYTEATLTEINRMASTLPLVPRCTSEDTMINGYFLKKGTCTVVNLYGVHMSSKIWGDPYTFRPERFLDGSGQLDSGMVSKVLAFGGGRRQCIAETWARATLFTYVTGLLQNFTLEFTNTVPPSEGSDDDENLNFAKDPESVIFGKRVKVGFSLYPHPFEVKVTRR